MKEAVWEGDRKKEMLTMLGADIVFVAAVCFVVGCNLYFRRRISSRIAMQWDLAGTPTWYAPKWIALWTMPAFMVTARTLIWAAMTFQPEKVHGPDVAVFGLSIVAAASHIFVLSKAVRSN